MVLFIAQLISAGFVFANIEIGGRGGAINNMIFGNGTLFRKNRNQKLASEFRNQGILLLSLNS
jgi:hypothetical protein